MLGKRRGWIGKLAQRLQGNTYGVHRKHVLRNESISGFVIGCGEVVHGLVPRRARRLKLEEIKQGAHKVSMSGLAVAVDAGFVAEDGDSKVVRVQDVIALLGVLRSAWEREASRWWVQASGVREGTKEQELALRTWSKSSRAVPGRVMLLRRYASFGMFNSSGSAPKRSIVE